MRKEKLDELKSYIEELRTFECTKIETRGMVKILNSMIENLTKEKQFLKIERYACKLNNGHTIQREKLLKGGKNGSAAIILPVTKDEQVVLSVEPRTFTKETVDAGLPAGYIEENERAIDAARRELLEETGYITQEENIIHLGSFYQDQGCSGALNEYFIAFNCEKQSSQSLDRDEFIKYYTCTFDEMVELLNNGYIKGLNSAYVIEKAKQYIYARRNQEEGRK